MQLVDSYKRSLDLALPHLLKMAGATALALAFAYGVAWLGWNGLLGKPLLVWVALVLGTFMACGFLRNTLRLCRGQPFDIYAFLLVPPGLVLRLLGVAALMVAAILVGLAFFLIPGIVAFSAFYFAPVLVIDKGLGPLQALGESARMTRGHRVQLLLGHFVATVLYTLAALPAFTLVFAIPLYWFYLVTPYLELNGENTPCTPAKAEHLSAR